MLKWRPHRKFLYGKSFSPQLSWLGLLVLVTLWTALFAGCAFGGANPSPTGPAVTELDNEFSPRILHIKAGQAVTFDDPSSSGGTHQLVTGTQGQFSAAAGAPSEFSSNSGIMFHPGDSKSITFPTAGTYQITCTIHPSMQATITVTP